MVIGGMANWKGVEVMMVDMVAPCIALPFLSIFYEKERLLFLLFLLLLLLLILWILPFLRQDTQASFDRRHDGASPTACVRASEERAAAHECRIC